ncbi:MAG: hypothetical protein V4531_05415 [Actinomycetota bacterium]
MTAGDDSAAGAADTGAADTGGPDPITAPFAWGLGSAAAPGTGPGSGPRDAPGAPGGPAEVAAVTPAATELIPAGELSDANPAPFRTPSTGQRPAPDSSHRSGSVSADFGDSSSDEIAPASPIDALFGATQFKDYEGEPVVGRFPLSPNGVAAAAASGAPGTVGAASAGASAGTLSEPDRAARASLSKNQKLLMWVAGGVIALLVLALLFVVGTRIAPAPAPNGVSKSVGPSPGPSPSSSPGGPASFGIRLWSDLRGGECIDTFTSPFAQKFTVVDCASPHPAQLVMRGTFPGEVTAAWPGLDALQSQANQLCTAPGVMDLTTAGAYNDIQLQPSYAAATDEWTGGQRDYFCFVTRSSGGPITGSVAGATAK